MDTVLLFNENTSSPMASVTMKDIPTTTLHHIISSNQYLALPRLSSQVSSYRWHLKHFVMTNSFVPFFIQTVFESLCPCEWNKPRKKLCVVLVTEASRNHDIHRQLFRLYAQNSPYRSEKVRFAYIYHDKQSEFVNSLIPSKYLLLAHRKLGIFNARLFFRGAIDRASTGNRNIVEERHVSCKVRMAQF